MYFRIHPTSYTLAVTASRPLAMLFRGSLHSVDALRALTSYNKQTSNFRTKKMEGCSRPFHKFLKLIRKLLFCMAAIGASTSAFSSESRSLLLHIHNKFVAASVSKLTSAEDFVPLEGIYSVHFSRHGLPATQLSDEELQVSFRLSTQMANLSSIYNYSEFSEYVDDARERYEELDNRDIISLEECSRLFRVLHEARLFDEAIVLGEACQLPEKMAVPIVHVAQPFDPEAPATLTLDHQSNSYRLGNMEQNPSLLIVAVGSCHFAKDAAQMINGDPHIRDAFLTGNIIWLDNTQRSLDPAFVRDWNQEFPLFPISTPYRYAAWPDVDFTSSPGFFFFIDGNLIAKHVGWNKSVPMEIPIALRRMGLLKSAPHPNDTQGTSD